MITEKKYKETQKYYNSKKEYCDRCGNDLAVGQSALMHFPYRKIYIVLCQICHGGLQFGFYQDFLRIVEGKNEK